MKNQHDLGRRDGEFILYKPSEIENELPFQLVGAGCDFYQYPIERPFGFPVYHWIQSLSGRGCFECAGSEWICAPGEGMLLLPNEAHKYYPAAGEEAWYVNWITFSGYLVPNMLHYLGMDKSGVYRVSNPSASENLVRKALQLLKSDYVLKGIDGSALIYNLLLDFLKYLEKDGEDSHSGAINRLKPALDLIERDMHKPIELEDMASAIGVTPQYFCEIFKSLTSQRPVEYLNQRRIERAKELLIREPHSKIHDIALKVGFENDSYFGTVFRKYEGVSPRQFRETSG